MKIFIILFMLTITLSENLLAMKRIAEEDLSNPAKKLKEDAAHSSAASKMETIVIPFRLKIAKETMDFESIDKKYKAIWVAPEKNPSPERAYILRYYDSDIVTKMSEQEFQSQMNDILERGFSLSHVSIHPHEFVIRHLDLAAIIEPELFNVFWDALALNKTVEKLELSHLNEKNIAFLPQALERNKSIVSLTIYASDINSEDCAHCLGQAIKDHTMLKMISVSYCNVGDVFVNCMVPYFKDSHLLDIDLEHAGSISVKTAQSLCELLKLNGQMTGLDFSLLEDSSLEDEFIIVKEVAEILRKNLRLQRFALTDAMNDELQDRLKVNKKLDESWLKYGLYFMARHEIRESLVFPLEIIEMLCLSIFLSDLAELDDFDLSKSLHYEATMDYPDFLTQ